MPHRYQVVVQPLGDDASEPSEPLTFETVNHDDLLEIVAKVRSRGILPDDEVAPCAVGLKLFSEVLLHHRNQHPFNDLWPHIATFIKALKALPDGAERP